MFDFRTTASVSQFKAEYLPAIATTVEALTRKPVTRLDWDIEDCEVRVEFECIPEQSAVMYPNESACPYFPAEYNVQEVALYLQNYSQTAVVIPLEWVDTDDFADDMINKVSN